MNQDWYAMFVPTHSLLEKFVRGTIMYLAIFLLLRFLPKRQTGSLSTPDILLIVLLADAAQNAMANEYRSVTEGIALVCTIIFWNFAIGSSFTCLRSASGCNRHSCFLSRTGKYYGSTFARNSLRWMN